MGGKLVAGLVTAVVIAPVCAVCILGPAFLGSAFGWALGWFSGLGPIATLATAVVAGLAVTGLVRWRGSKGATGKDPTAHGPDTQRQGTR